MAEEKNGQVIDVSNVPVGREEIEILPDDLDGRINIIKKQNNALMKIMDELLEPEVDYGTVPGVDKPFLWQSGAQQLGLVFKFRPVFEIINSTIDWNRNPIFVSYEVKCQLYNKETGVFLGEGVGSANNYERKFKYYWKYPKNGEKYREVFEDPLDKQNTLLKMAKKRAYVDAHEGSYHASGDTASRPSSPGIGLMYFDTDLGIPIWWNGNGWVDATGTLV